MVDVKQNPKSEIPNPNNGQLIGQVSGGSKEVEKPVSDFVTPSEQLKKLEKEVEEAGVKKVSETPQFDETQKQAGIMHPPADTPVQTEPSGIVQLPMTENDAKSVMAQYKNKVTYDIGEHGEHDAYVVASRLGLATLVDKINKFINLFRPKKKATA